MRSSIRNRFTVFVAVLAVAILVVGVLATPAYAKSQPAKMKKIIRHVAHNYGLKKADIKALITLCKRESDFDPRERTGSCKGLFQLKTSFGRSRWTNPAWNTRRAIRYIKHRYGTATAALRHSNRYGWY